MGLLQRAGQFPAVNASGTRDFYRLPKKMSTTGESQTVEQHVNLGSVSWELDFFGRIRSLKSQALEQYLATQQARSATQIALVAAVANSYLALAADRENLRLAQETLKTQQALYELILRTREAGMASDLDVRQAESQVEAARADIARYSGQVAVDENALNLLAGTSVPADLLPGELNADLKDVAAGIPSEVLLRRPDILSAEHQLKAAYANIGAARAAFFPRISLTGGAGFMSSDLSDLYQFGARTWNFAPQLILPIFDAGARRANVKVAQVDRDAAIAEYEKAIQTAFREVSDSLSLRTRLMEQQEVPEARELGQRRVPPDLVAHRLQIIHAVRGQSEHVHSIRGYRADLGVASAGGLPLLERLPVGTPSLRGPVDAQVLRHSFSIHRMTPPASISPSGRGPSEASRGATPRSWGSARSP